VTTPTARFFGSITDGETESVWRFAAAAVLTLWSTLSHSQLSTCVEIGDPMTRLACYDDLARRGAAREPESAAPAKGVPAATETIPASKPGSLEERWELRPELKRGTFNLVPYKPVYGLMHWTSARNEHPSSPTRAFTGPASLDRVEAKMQLSFKTKVAEGVLGTSGDLWFGYTQVSYWQLGNSRSSSPFRESNYEPEMMYVHPLQASIGGLHLRFLGLGLNHQSNGRGTTLSRSWNRVIGEVAAEYGPWTFQVRPWARVFTPSGDRDDNPGIQNFAGRGEVVVTRRAGAHTWRFTGRHSLRSGNRSHGGVQLDWAFPLVGALNGHVQVFSGYGQSLIDYNHRQTTVGLGVSFFD
jgi:phospholipase A1/A2